MKLILRSLPALKFADNKIIYNRIDEPFLIKSSKHSDKIVFLYCSHWSRDKGLGILLQAVSKLESVTSNFELLIAGSEDLWYSDYTGENKRFAQEVRSTVKKLKNVRILKGIKYKDMPSLYSNSDCLVFPSLWNEPFATVILESLTSGLPVLAFDVGGVSEAVQNNYNGFVLSKKTPQTLYAKMFEIIQNPSQLGKVAKNCRKSVVVKFSKHKRVQELNKIFNKVRSESEGIHT